MRTILITGAGSGLGEGAAIGLARQGHEVIAAAQAWPQVTALRARVDAEKIPHLRVEKLDLLDPYDVRNALRWSFDILVNNAGMAEGGPIAEIRRRVKSYSYHPSAGSSAHRDSPRMLQQSMPWRLLPKRCNLNLSPLEFKCRPSTPEPISRASTRRWRRMRFGGSMMRSISPNATPFVQWLQGSSEARVDEWIRTT